MKPNIIDQEEFSAVAKAIGLEIVFSTMEDIPPRRRDNWEHWNPRDDSSDAFDVAAKLRLKVDFSDSPDHCKVSSEDGKHVRICLNNEYGASGAARRAIIDVARMIAAC